MEVDEKLQRSRMDICTVGAQIGRLMRQTESEHISVVDCIVD